MTDNPKDPPVPERLVAVGNALVQSLHELRAEVAQERRSRRFWLAAFALTLVGAIVVGFVTIHGLVQDARDRCVGGNGTRQAVVLGFELNADGLLAAYGFDRNNPPDPNTETGARVAIFLDAQEQVINAFEFADCNDDGDVDGEDGVDLGRPPFGNEP